jgi:hypothetical protein
MPEVDLAFWSPLWLDQPGAPRRLVFFLPYIFVDSSASVAAGREIYGFPKALGRFAIHRDERGLASLTLDADALRTFSPESTLSSLRLVTVERLEGEAPGAARLVEGLLSSLGDGLALAPRLHARVPMIFLKQIRDAERPERAAHQSLVLAEARITEVRRSGFASARYRARWGEAASHPIARDLGLGAGEQEAAAAFSVDFDFVLEAGRELWRGASR